MQESAVFPWRTRSTWLHCAMLKFGIIYRTWSTPAPVFGLATTMRYGFQTVQLWQPAIVFILWKLNYLMANPGRLGAAWIIVPVDSSAIGVQIDAINILRIHGGSIWAHHFGVILNARGNVILAGADVRANSDHCLQIKDCDSLTVTGCLFKKNGTAWPDTAKVQLNGGRSVLLNGCTFDENSVGISIGPEAKRFSITGNIFAKMEYRALVDKSSSDAKKVIAENLAG